MKIDSVLLDGKIGPRKNQNQKIVKIIEEEVLKIELEIKINGKIENIGEGTERGKTKMTYRR